MTNMMFCWNPGGSVALVPWPDTANRSKAFSMSGGACYSHTHKMSFEERKAMAFIEAVILIVRDQCDPHEVHKAFLGLEEYAHGLPDEMLPKELLRIRREDEE